ncbi:sulfite exporter TauE/SafE family protein [Leptospira sp. GIMC2001]|uniref:sulfite exporter TauE/SafE family protein n=1 Tax=Leptospira sp. GIMC2001 TaxID=1513297 RepID=UPI00234A0C0E|nr:sulfite exporter TauE/SafE family protein [Leptospira sp. GIMC2001]WCL48945.1 sulfite exporter TauE/SafE family protein [Leptospira sp. GIMC2001]
MEFIFFYLIAGILVGLLAGLFGVGGGIIMVPILTFSFVQMGFSREILFHLAIGTSLATILFTSIVSLLTHHRNQAVIWKVVLFLSPGVVAGTLLGSLFAANLKSQELKYIFIFFIYLFSFKMLFSKKKKSILDDSNIEKANIVSSDSPEPKLPHFAVQSFTGLLIGISSALVGVGGGVFTSSYLILFRTPIHLAIGTAAAIGFPIALSGGVGFIYNGWNNQLLPDGSSGFVYWPAVAGLVVASMPFAYIGAKISHRLPKDRLRQIFAIFLMSMATIMLVS